VELIVDLIVRESGQDQCHDQAQYGRLDVGRGGNLHQLLIVESDPVPDLAHVRFHETPIELPA